MIPAIDRVRTGQFLRILMQQSGVSPKDIQAYLSLTCVQTVYRWMAGVNLPSLDNLYALSRLFGVTMDDMVTGNRDNIEKGAAICRYRRLTQYYKNWKKMTAA